jgi:hypothetical protein
VTDLPELAIKREPIEEVGLIDVELDPVIWERTHEFPSSESFGGQHETLFLVRTQQSVLEPSFSQAELSEED